jgi:hypothetical protein
MDWGNVITENAGITLPERGLCREGSFYKEAAVPFQQSF